MSVGNLEGVSNRSSKRGNIQSGSWESGVWGTAPISKPWNSVTDFPWVGPNLYTLAKTADSSAKLKLCRVSDMESWRKDYCFYPGWYYRYGSALLKKVVFMVCENYSAQGSGWRSISSILRATNARPSECNFCPLCSCSIFPPGAHDEWLWMKYYALALYAGACVSSQFLDRNCFSQLDVMWAPLPGPSVLGWRAWRGFRLYASGRETPQLRISAAIYGIRTSSFCISTLPTSLDAASSSNLLL